MQRSYGVTAGWNLGETRLSATISQAQDDANNISSVSNAAAQNFGQAKQTYIIGDNFGYRSRNRVANVQDVVPVMPGVTLDVGGEYQQQLAAASEFDPNGANSSMPAFSRYINSFWLGNNGHLGAQQWQLNLRRDAYSDFGNATTGLAAWGLALTSEWKWTVQWSTAFRAPSFQDLYYPGTGNTALQPEHARAGQTGLRWTRGGADAGIVLYRTRVADMIGSGPGPSYQSINVGHAAMDGAELQGGVQFGAWHLSAGASLDHARNTDTDVALVRRARYGVQLAADYVHGPWSGSVSAQRVGARDDFDINSFAQISGLLRPYDLARTAVACRVGSHVTLRLRVENLFNAHYQLVDGYNTLPRMIIAGVEAHI